jgi:hypothetical protein
MGRFRYWLKKRIFTSRGLSKNVSQYSELAMRRQPAGGRNDQVSPEPGRMMPTAGEKSGREGACCAAILSAITLLLALPRKGGVKDWRPQGDSNPRYRRERAMSWASRRWGRTKNLVEPDGIEPSTSCMPCKRSPS